MVVNRFFLKLWFDPIFFVLLKKFIFYTESHNIGHNLDWVG